MPALIEPHDEFMGAVQQVGSVSKVVGTETHVSAADHSIII